MKKILLLLVLIISSKLSYAQVNIEAERSIIQNAPFIFEGEVIRTYGYFNEDRSRVYRTSEIRITRSVKGDLTSGTVQVTYKGQRVAAIIPAKDGNDPIIQVPDDNGLGQDIWGVTLPANKTVLFFCHELSTSFTPAPTKLETTNSRSLEIVGLAYDLFGDNKVVSDVGGKFDSFSKLYDYLSTSYQIASPAPERKITQEEINTAGQVNREQWNLMDQRMREIKESQKKVNSSKTIFAPQANEELTFTIRDPMVTGTGTRYLEYDVYIQSNTGGSYFNNAVMEFSYNTAAFGNSLGAPSNNQVTATSGSAFTAPTYRQPNVVTGNDPTPTFRVGVGVVFNGSGFNRVRVNNTPIKLVHIKIQIQNCVANSGVEFVNDAYVADTYDMYALSPTTPDRLSTYRFYTPVTYTDFPGGISLCSSPTINFFTPSVKAGTAMSSAGNSLMIVSGSGFGTTRGTIQMKDADVGGAKYLTLDNYDIESWTNTEIRVRVPGKVKVGSASTPINPTNGACGSGKFKIITAGGAIVESTSELDVEYAILPALYSDINNQVVNKARRLLAKNNCVDGYTFRIDNTLKNNPLALLAIENALAEWSVKTGVYLSLERDAQGDPVAQSSFPSQSDGINSISYASFSASSNALMVTSPYLQPCGSGSTLKNAFSEVDITVNGSGGINWDYSLQGNVQGVSFLSALLHELGHALGLGHVVSPNTASNNQKELMYFEIANSPPSADRQSTTSGRGKAIIAATDNVAQSKLQSWCTSNLLTLGSTNSSACQSTKPLAPSLQATANSGLNKTITLRWNSIYNATGYTLQSSVKETSGFTDYALIWNGSTNTYTTGNLDPQTPYYFRIKATNAAGSSTYSNVASATTSQRPAPSPLVSPTAFQGTASGGGNTLSNQLNWSYSFSGASFVITRSTNIEFRDAVSYVTSLDVRSFIDNNINPGTVYFYRIKAQLGGSSSDDTSPITVTATGCVPLGLVGSIAYIGIIPWENSNSTTCTIQQADGATSIVWNFTSPIALTEGWALSGGFESTSVSYRGPLPYNGTAPILQAEVISNCGTSVMRYLQMPTPASGPSDPTSRTAFTGVEVYPNPASGQLYVTLTEDWKSSQIRLVNLTTGKAVREWKAKDFHFEADIHDLPSGVYIIEFTSHKQTTRQRLEVAQ